MSTHQSVSRTVDLPRLGALLGDRRRFAALAVAVGLVASACSSGSAAPDTPEASAAGTAAAANSDFLSVNEDVRLTEVLDVADGSVQSLTSAVDGDRPVLLWFWAPH
jgi:hypothetical protein